MTYLQKIVQLTYTMPFSELIHGFYDQLKGVSSGFATLDYELVGYRPSELVRLDIMVGGERIDALSQIVPQERAPYVGRELVEQLKNVIPRQQFEVPIQAAIGGKVIARADIKSFRKDVIAKLSGGDQTRKDKLLKIQAKGKARMKRVGRIDIPQEAFLTILKVS
jgi:GTP-binding protein LepA